MRRMGCTNLLACSEQSESASVIDGAFQDIAVIDLSCATNLDENKKKVLAYQIRDACMSVGFFYGKSSVYA